MKDKHKVFFDTNILVYAHDIDAGQKHKVALRLVEDAWGKQGHAVISTQILQEFYVTLTKKGLPADKALELVKDYAQWELVNSDAPLTFEAVVMSQRFKISFWDGLVLAAALRANARTVYSEDLSHHQKYRDLMVINPFK